MMETVTCENCGEKIGNLETPHLWNDRVVCAPCKAKLNGNGSLEAPAPLASPAPLAYAAPTVTNSPLPSQPKEVELYRVRSSIWQWIVLGIIFLFFAGFGLLFFLIAWVVWSNECIVTNRKITVRSGILSRRVIEIPLGKVAAIEIQKGFGGFGKVTIGGHGLSNAAVPQLADPEKLRDEINRAVEAYSPR